MPDGTSGIFFAKGLDRNSENRTSGKSVGTNAENVEGISIRSVADGVSGKRIFFGVLWIFRIYSAPAASSPQAPAPLHSFERTLPLKIGETSYTDYTFDDPWELVPGPWKIQFWLGDHKLGEQDFDIVANWGTSEP